MNMHVDLFTVVGFDGDRHVFVMVEERVVGAGDRSYRFELAQL